jgi:short-subunit dehydrogenase
LELAKDNILISAIHPGFVKTSLTDQNKHPMPLIMSSEKAAEIIFKGIEKSKAVIAFPKVTFYLMRLLSILPVRLADGIVRNFIKY